MNTRNTLKLPHLLNFILAKHNNIPTHTESHKYFPIHYKLHHQDKTGISFDYCNLHNIRILRNYQAVKHIISKYAYLDWPYI